MNSHKDSEILVYMPFEDISKSILSHYDLDIQDMEFIKFKNTEKQRAVYKIITKDGPKCLKKVFYDKETLLFIYSVTEWLNLNHVHCPRFVTTTNGHKYVCYNDNLFILTDWINGRKCSYDNMDDVVSMSENLSKIHTSSHCFRPIAGSLVSKPNTYYFYGFRSHFYHLLEFWNKSMYFQDSFSKLFMDMFDYSSEMAKESVNLINTIDFSKPFGDSISLNAICHLDYVNKNIVFDDAHNIYTIDFDNTRFDFPVHDICYFLRRLLKREETSWSFDIFEKTIRSYEQQRPLGREEFMIILAILMFPQKYWKLSKDYFKNKKYCNPAPFLDSMDKIHKKQSEHEIFIKKLKKYIQNRF